jgi:abortive infection bacteriophage resistance protein
MTFGQATTMYSLVSNNIRNCIAQDLGTIASTNQYQGNSQVIRLSPKNIDVIFGNFKDMRNLLAHDNMIFDEKFRTGFPYFKEIHNRFNIPADTAKQSVYDAFIMMRMFLTERQFAIVYNTALGAAKRLNNKLKVANTSAILLSIGFPSNFCSEERIKQPE